MKSNETLNLIEEITLNDGEKYYEVSDIAQNGRAELAAVRGYIQSVRILQLNIPRSKNVIAYEKYINENFVMPKEDFDHFERWQRTPEMEKVVQKILRENHIA
ncbi:hypothetical protein SAMN05216431_11527 [Ligilactobacillus sp. WC1T17]|uniref:Uncharacterized protein n=1 Tax=Ligilactobacillus ruminis TaxID=1623 RepID=A0ABY1ADW9_9LACO|nr:hypothetical protein SAMN05216431_11527 [Ligilactobacillus ruminis]